MEARSTCGSSVLITGVVKEGNRSFWELGLGLLHHFLGVWIGAWFSRVEQITRVSVISVGRDLPMMLVYPCWKGQLCLRRLSILELRVKT